MSKPITLSKVSRESWHHFLGECHEAGIADPEALLDTIMLSPDLIRSAIAQHRQREATARGKVVGIGGER